MTENPATHLRGGSFPAAAASPGARAMETQAMSWRAALRAALAPLLIAGACAFALEFGYLVFHVAAEGFSILIALSALMVASTSRRFTKDHFLVYVAIGIDKALAEIERGRGTAYDANACVRLFREKGHALPA